MNLNALTEKKDEMSQDAYDDLIARIHTHCQQTTQEALHLGPADTFERLALVPSTHRAIFCRAVWADQSMNAVGWYVRERKSYISLKKEAQGQITFAFPPATEQQIKETEQHLTFPLPPLLRLLYTQIANGGFGPGYGITGAVGGYRFHDISVHGDIAQAYHQAVEEARTFRQSFLDHFLTLDPEEQKAREQSGWVDALPSLWPEHVLPLCQWGCNISTYINADTEQIFQGMSGPDLLIAASLEEWLERWLAGEELQFM